eukprot:gene2231-biopygen4379
MASMKRKKRKKVRPKELLRKRSNWKTRPKTQRLSAEKATMPASQTIQEIQYRLSISPKFFIAWRIPASFSLTTLVIWITAPNIEAANRKSPAISAIDESCRPRRVSASPAHPPPLPVPGERERSSWRPGWFGNLLPPIQRGGPPHLLQARVGELLDPDAPLQGVRLPGLPPEVPHRLTLHRHLRRQLGEHVGVLEPAPEELDGGVVLRHELHRLAPRRDLEVHRRQARLRVGHQVVVHGLRAGEALDLVGRDGLRQVVLGDAGDDLLNGRVPGGRVEQAEAPVLLEVHVVAAVGDARHGPRGGVVQVDAARVAVLARHQGLVHQEREEHEEEGREHLQVRSQRRSRPSAGQSASQRGGVSPGGTRPSRGPRALACIAVACLFRRASSAAEAGRTARELRQSAAGGRGVTLSTEAPAGSTPPPLERRLRRLRTTGPA